MAGGSDVVVAGAGVIGLSIAWHLLRRGIPVAVLDAEDEGAASPAGAGMLAPLAEGADGALLALGAASLHRYPGFLDALAEDGGERVILDGPGTITLRPLSKELEAAARLHGLRVEPLDRRELQALVPGLTTECSSVTLSTDEKHVDPRALLRALRAAILARGGRILAARALGLASDGRRVAAVRTPDGVIPCDTVVVAAGAWSDRLLAPLSLEIGVRPARGQIVLLDHARLPRHTIYGDDIYLVPRRGRLLVGATVEDVGFDARSTPEGVAMLTRAAVALLPSLREATVAEAWAGLRPRGPGALPLVGPVPDRENLWVATAHFRNGILLAPLTGELVAAGIADPGIPAAMLPLLPDSVAATR